MIEVLRTEPDCRARTVLSVLTLVSLEGLSEFVRLLREATACPTLALPRFDREELERRYPPAVLADWERGFARARAPGLVGDRWRRVASECAASSAQLAERMRRIARAADAFTVVAARAADEADRLEEELAAAREADSAAWLVSYWAAREWERDYAAALLREPLQASRRHTDAADFDLVMLAFDEVAAEVSACVAADAALTIRLRA